MAADQRRVAVWVVLAGLAAGCATAPAAGRGGAVYQVRVAAVNGRATASRGPMAHPACVLQVGGKVATVWLAHPSRRHADSPVVLEADAEALKDGILVERSWSAAVVHHVTDAELAAGAALVYVPGGGRVTTVELRFEPLSWLSRSDRENDLAKRRPALEHPVGGGDVR